MKRKVLTTQSSGEALAAVYIKKRTESHCKHILYTSCIYMRAAWKDPLSLASAENICATVAEIQMMKGMARSQEITALHTLPIRSLFRYSEFIIAIISVIWCQNKLRSHFTFYTIAVPTIQGTIVSLFAIQDTIASLVNGLLYRAL